MVIITGHPLQKMTVKKFTDNNYPKSYGNMNINFYRLSTFKGRNAAELEKIAEDLWQVILKKQESSKPLSVFKNYKLALLHGKLKSKDKERVLNEFRNRKYYWG